MICEGFQFILRSQADALLRLGVRAEFKVSCVSPEPGMFTDKRSDKQHVVPGWRVVSALETLPAKEPAGVHPHTSDQLPVQSGEFTKLPVHILLQLFS